MEVIGKENLRTNSKDYYISKPEVGLVYPSKDVEDLCKKAEKWLKTNFEKLKSEKYYAIGFHMYIVENYGESKNAFATSSSDHDASHKYLLMKSIFKTYIDIRFRYFGRKSTEKLSVRNYLNKIVFFPSFINKLL